MKKEEAFERHLRSLRTPFPKPAEESWKGVQQRIAAGTYRKSPVRLPYWVAAAAAVALLVSVAWWYQSPESEQREFATGALTTPQRIELPDGSVVVLNDHSRLSYNAGGFDKSRAVRLEGQASFDVKKSGADFTVTTSSGSVAVLGTVFDVLSTDNWFEVACYSGKVAVTNDVSGVTLSPGKATFTGPDGKLTAVPLDSDTPLWADGEFSYQDKPLERVLADVERQYEVKISHTLATGRTFTGYFSEEFALEETLEIICRPMGLTFVVKGKAVEITTPLK